MAYCDNYCPLPLKKLLLNGESQEDLPNLPVYAPKTTIQRAIFVSKTVELLYMIGRTSPNLQGVEWILCTKAFWICYQDENCSLERAVFKVNRGRAMGAYLTNVDTIPWKD